MASEEKTAGERVQQYFRVKAKQLEALGELAVCEHNGLAGSHREELHRLFLQEILPQRFAVSRGMVYGPMRRSKEADIVIWDAQNYPSLPMLDHAFFFAESVRVVLECKSQWEDKEFEDVLVKSRVVREIFTFSPPDTLEDRISKIEEVLASLQSGQELAGILINKPAIATAALFLRGGGTFTADSVSKERLEEADDSWPDILLLLEPGRLVLKRSDPQGEVYGETGVLEFFDLGPDALAVFTAELLRRLAERSVQIEESFYLHKYLSRHVDMKPVAQLPFRLSFPIPRRKSFHWGPEDRRLPEE